MYTRPDWARRVVAMGPSVGGAHHLVPLDADELIRTAVESTGLDDFGSDEWEEPLRRLIDSLNTDAKLHVLGRLSSRLDLLRHLRTRLLVVAAGPSNHEVRAPVFITGPARSGTSILHELLAEDPNLVAPRAWEMAHPFRPDGARAWAECEFDLWGDIQPEFLAVHELKASLPEECLWLLAPAFDGGFWTACTDVSSFMAWRAGTDILPAYRMHKRMLQLLQQGTEVRRWALKSPVHVSRLAALFAVYPDARVIFTHRDPVKTVPSVASTLVAGRWLRSDEVDPVTTGVGAAFGFSMLLNGAHEQRATLPAAQIADFHYRNLMRDPVAAIEAAYDTLGLTFDAGYPDRIRAYLDARPQTKYGVHRYEPQDFGLDPDQIREDFTPYTEAFGVEAE